MNNLPGSPHSFDPSWGEDCADCGAKGKASVSRQGETDSFGYELINLCADCAKKPIEPMIGSCDYCGATNQRLSPRRDPDEGMYGPVYEVCKPCIDRCNARIREEEEYYSYDDAGYRRDEEDYDSY